MSPPARLIMWEKHDLHPVSQRSFEGFWVTRGPASWWDFRSHAAKYRWHRPLFQVWHDVGSLKICQTLSQRRDNERAASWIQSDSNRIDLDLSIGRRSRSRVTRGPKMIPVSIFISVSRRSDLECAWINLGHLAWHISRPRLSNSVGYTFLSG